MEMTANSTLYPYSVSEIANTSTTQLPLYEYQYSNNNGSAGIGTTVAVEDPHCGWNTPNPDCDFLRWWKIVQFSLTLVCDLVTLCIILFLRSHKSFIQRIFLNIVIANSGEAVAVLMNNGLNSHWCIAAGFSTQYFGLVLFMWVCSLTFYVSLILLRNSDTKNYERYYRVVCWGLPFILALIPLIPLPDDGSKNPIVSKTGLHFGAAGAFCWIVDGKYGDPMRFALWWVPVMTGIVIIFILCVYLMIKGTTGSFAGGHDRRGPEHQRLMRKYLQPMAAYGAAFTLLHSLMLIDRIHTWTNPTPDLHLRMCHIIGFASYGMVLCTLYYLLSGKKEFKLTKWRSAWAYQRKRVLCKKMKVIVEMNIAQHIQSVLSLSEPSQRSSDNLPPYNNGGQQIEVLSRKGPQGHENPALVSIPPPKYKSIRVCQPDPSIKDDSAWYQSDIDLELSLSVRNFPVQCEDDISMSM